MGMTYEEAIQFLESFIDYEKIGGAYYTDKREMLASIKALLSRLGNPEKDLEYIHIAGTKGKGSTAAMATSILTAAGLKTGLYTSPHLIDFRERIKIDGKMISREDTATHVEALSEAALAVRDDPSVGMLSFFEVYTALAFLYFQRQKCDLVILETGLGGRLDATNVILPRVCAITLIGHDHEYLLGDTLEKIAIEKAGIFKPGVPAVIAPQPPEAEEALSREAQKVGIPAYWLREGNQEQLQKDQIQYQAHEESLEKRTFRFQGLNKTYDPLESPLIGRHQITNAATAVALVELATAGRADISQKVIQNGLKQTVWPGRFQIVSREPLIVLDGAHNPESAVILRNTVKEQLNYDRLILIFGGMSDHNLRKVAESLFPMADHVVLTRSKNPRAATPEKLMELTGDLCKKYTLAQTTFKALETAKANSGKKDAILIVGSLYIVGEAMTVLIPETQRSL
jgi:dihydrofolate synthase/folylpolyglutamate synthase